jgi:hypothetical protein
MCPFRGSACHASFCLLVRLRYQDTIHIHMYVCMYTRARAHTHTHTHTYIYTQTFEKVSLSRKRLSGLESPSGRHPRRGLKDREKGGGGRRSREGEGGGGVRDGRREREGRRSRESLGEGQTRGREGGKKAGENALARRRSLGLLG